MNWNQLQYILVTAREKSVTKAAKKLYISQPSLSISIRELEKELGCPLFERKNGKLTLTYGGTLFCQWANTVLSSKNNLQEQFAQISSNQRECIRIGISPHRSTAISPHLICRIHDKFPDCEIHLVEKPNYELKTLLDAGELDILLHTPETDKVTYHCEEIIEEGLCLAVPDSFVGKEPFLEDAKEISLGSLGNYPFLMLPESSYLGFSSRELLKQAGITPNILCECTFSETVKNLVGKQLGIALLPAFFRSEYFETSHIRFYQIADISYSRTLALLYRNGHPRSPLFLEIAGLIRDCVYEIYSLQ